MRPVAPWGILCLWITLHTGPTVWIIREAQFKPLTWNRLWGITIRNNKSLLMQMLNFHVCVWTWWRSCNTDHFGHQRSSCLSTNSSCFLYVTGATHNMQWYNCYLPQKPHQIKAIIMIIASIQFSPRTEFLSSCPYEHDEHDEMTDIWLAIPYIPGTVKVKITMWNFYSPKFVCKSKWWTLIAMNIKRYNCYYMYYWYYYLVVNLNSCEHGNASKMRTLIPPNCFFFFCLDNLPVYR